MFSHFEAQAESSNQRMNEADGAQEIIIARGSQMNSAESASSFRENFPHQGAGDTVG